MAYTQSEAEKRTRKNWLLAALLLFIAGLVGVFAGGKATSLIFFVIAALFLGLAFTVSERR